MIENKIVVVFCYNRLLQLQNLIQDIKKNTFFGKIKILFVQDGLDQKNKYESTAYTHQKIKEILINFRNENQDLVEVRFNSINLGLAKTIEQTLDNISKSYQSMIVLEDDLRISNKFLEIMNYYLDKCKENKKIWHINGWSPYSLFKIKNHKMILTNMMYCWGWATWSDRWIKYRNDSNIKNKNYISFFQLLKFDYFGVAGHYHQLKMNWIGKRKTWAIFWQLYLWSKNFSCLSVSTSLVTNDGLHDGENCKTKLKFNYLNKVIGGEIDHDFFTKDLNFKESIFFEIRVIYQMILRDIFLLTQKILLFLK